MTRKPRGEAKAATRTNVTQAQLAETYSSAGCLRCCVADTPRTLESPHRTMRGDCRKCAACKVADGGILAESALFVRRLMKRGVRGAGRAGRRHGAR
jgi:hypothetical protein